jgi:archaellum biogenesis ATPase FlaH
VKKFDLFKFRNYKENPISFGVDVLDKITCGGLHDRSINYLFANTGGGKTLFLCHVAASAMRQNKNVLFITDELYQYKIYERIQANLLNDTILNLYDKDNLFFNRLNVQTLKTLGNLTVIDDYHKYSSFAEFMSQHEDDIENTMFVEPDIILIDSTNNDLENDNEAQLQYHKTCIDHNIPILVSTRLDRVGSMFRSAIKFGIEITDKTVSSYTFRQVKNRYSDPDKNQTFTIGVDCDKMKLYNVEQSKLES